MAFPTLSEYESLVYGLLDAFPDLASSTSLSRAAGLGHNRRPARGIRSQAPNLPTLIADCIQLGQPQP